MNRSIDSYADPVDLARASGIARNVRNATGRECRIVTDVEHSMVFALAMTCNEGEWHAYARSSGYRTEAMALTSLADRVQEKQR